MRVRSINNWEPEHDRKSTVDRDDDGTWAITFWDFRQTRDPLFSLEKIQTEETMLRLREQWINGSFDELRQILYGSRLTICPDCGEFHTCRGL